MLTSVTRAVGYCDSAKLYLIGETTEGAPFMGQATLDITS